MNAALAVLALALPAAEGAPKEAAPLITYEFRVLEMNGVEWRQGVYASLQPVTRQGATTVWTTTDRTADAIVKKAGHTVAAPRLTARSTAPVHLSTKTARGLVTHLNRQADGPVNHANSVVCAPETERIRDGFTTTITGRKLDQGVLVQLVFEDTRVTAVHPVYLTEMQHAKEGADHEQARWEQIEAKLEVPEIVQNELAGEWLIPKDGVLLASLGAHCVADAQGKAVVRERLVLMKAVASSPFAVAVFAHDAQVATDSHQRPMPAPTAPSRTLPQGVNADGEPVPLPPLPPEAPAPTARPDSAEPVATPQTKHHSPAPGADTPEPPKTDGAEGAASPATKRPAPEVDPATSKTSFSTESGPNCAPRTDLPWAKPAAANAAGMQAMRACPTAGACCESALNDLPPLPEPLPEAPAAPAPPRPRTAGRSQHRGDQTPAEPLPEAAMTAAGAQGFWTDDKRLQPIISFERPQMLSAAPPPPVQAYHFRWPLNGVDLEVRIVSRLSADSAGRTNWRPSEQTDTPEN